MARAIDRYAENIGLYNVTDQTAVPGRGISGIIEGRKYFGGNAAFMSELGVDISAVPVSDGTPMYFACEKELLGVIYASDKIKSDSAQAIERMSKAGLEVIFACGKVRSF